MEPDFAGYATKAGLRCTDGRTIMPDAFKHQDKMQVPLVWQHGHKNIEDVLGHAILENRPDGVYTYAYFNDSPKAKHAKELVRHRDIKQLSIWANELIERTGKVFSGAIREVSLVLSGANPGANIDPVTIRHANGEENVLEDEAIITTGEDFELMHMDTETPELVHVDTATADVSPASAAASSDDETIADIYNSMSEKQKDVLHFMLGEAISSNMTDTGASATETATHDNLDDNPEKDQKTMTTRNVFEKDSLENQEAKTTLSHDAMKSILADATRSGSLKEAVYSYAIAHGITDIDTLFPEATTLGGAPEFVTKNLAWVDGVLSAVKKSPFARIKTRTADLTADAARAKGYITGNLKKEQFFTLASRVTIPTTVYKTQKLDRDDMIDITDFDVVTWLKGEMRVMLNAELARAILIGDGRAVDDFDRINPANIRPIATDDPLYAVPVEINLNDADSGATEIVDAIIRNRGQYRGSGLPTFYTTESYISQFMLLRDTEGRRLYKSVAEVESEMRVQSMVAVEAMEEDPLLVGILVNLSDYMVGADRGGAITMFDDFDIDYNQYKYLIETRMSGALTVFKSALVIRRTLPAAP